MKKEFLILLLLLIFFDSKAQVNMEDGTMGFSVPVYSYTDKLSKLSLNTQLVYSSGKGLEVNEISNSIGTKWDLNGIPVVTRVINGLPDDQVEKPGDIFNFSKYPPGYLYNSNAISLGCPTALSKYPVFENDGVWIDDNNITQADRELDQFQFVLNGFSGSFVIDKNFNAVQLNDTRAKIEIFTGDQTTSKNIRTSIKEFNITDENGVKYFFAEQETSRAFKMSEHDPNNYTWILGGEIFLRCYDIPLADNPFITSAWHVTKIVDTKTNRTILFSYVTENTKYEAHEQLQTQLFDATPSAPSYGSGATSVTGTTIDNHNYAIIAYNTKGVIQKRDIQKKKISSIIFPDESRISFDYLTDRMDIADTKMLDKISVFDMHSNLLLSYNLEHSYFIKNEIKQPASPAEKPWSRLCLTQIRKSGSTVNITENPWQFEYYTGTNNTEDIVAPYFFHAKDQWGYYNGSNSGVTTTAFLGDYDKASWSKVCIYNQPHNLPGAGGAELFFNSKNGYAKNGLLKTIINPFGGKTEYHYEQNYAKRNMTNHFLSYDYSASGDAVGGVHVSKVIEKPDNLLANELTTEYIYTDDFGVSTLWGLEALKFDKVSKTAWEAEDKYFNGLDCEYRYKYPALQQFTVNSALEDFKLFLRLPKAIGNVVKAVKMLDNLIKISKVRKLNATDYEPGLNLILEHAKNILISCASPTPQRLNDDIITFGNSINTNSLPIQYKKVTRKDYSGGVYAGKTVTEFTSPGDFPLILPAEAAGLNKKIRGYNWIYGLTKSIRYYDNSGVLVKSIENEYENKKTDVTDVNTNSCNCDTYLRKSLRSDQWNTSATFNDFTNVNTYNISGLIQKVEFYNIVLGHPELKKVTHITYNSSGDAFVTGTDYLYNPLNNLQSSVISTTSKGTRIETKTYYLEDYNLANPANTVLNQMKNDHILNVPVSTETWQTKAGGGSIPEMLSASITEFGLAPNGDYRAVKTYSLETDKPVPQSVIGTFDPDQLVRNNTLIKQQSELFYDAYGNNVSAKEIRGNKTGTTLFGYENSLPVVMVNNAMSNEVAYTSFELNDNSNNAFYWNWSSNSGNTPSNIVPPTGKRYADGMSQSDIISYKNKAYTLSFWSKNNDFLVTPQVLLTPKITGPTINGWTYHEYDVAPTSAYYILSVDGNGSGIDELRLYPKNSTMTSTTYDVSVGKTSECDINNRITYYEYDGLGRIVRVLDDHRNIIKTYEYHFKN